VVVAYTGIDPPRPLPEDKLGGAGNTTGFEEMLVPVATDGCVGTDVGVFWGESVGGGGGGGGDRGSMVTPTAVVPVSESAGEPVVDVSRKK